MTTHSIQFGKHPGHAHSHGSSSPHTQQFNGHFATARAKSSGDPQHDALVKQTEKWVSQTFYGEMLKQMRNSPFKSKMFDGGEGGQAFTEMFDQQLADKMSKGAGKKLVDSIVNKIEAGKAYRAAAGKKPVAHHLPIARHAAPAHHVPIKAPPLSPTLRAKIGALP